MPKYSTAFGMDVHLRSTTVCALDADTGEAVTRRFPGNPWGEIAGWMDGFPGPSLAAYESGYLGFAPQRELAGLGVECVVAAVSKIPRSAADSASKNDRNDAARMAKAILAHDISVSVNIFFTIFTNVFSPIAPTRMRRIRQRGCAAFGV